MSTSQRQCKFRVGQRVECLKTSFEKATWLQELWVPGTVVSVSVADETRGLWNVHVQHGPTSWSPEIVGPRGGNKRIRATP